MTNALFGFPPTAPHASGSGFTVKRKSRAWSYDEEEGRETQLRRVKSPPFERRSTWQNPAAPELVVSNSAMPAGTVDGSGMDVDMDANGDQNMGDGNADLREQGGCGISTGYSFGNGGSGGFGFGPGAEEDDEDLDLNGQTCQYPAAESYPSLTPHPNPNHYLNQQQPLNYARATSPLAIQTFSPSLVSPSSRGIYQPAASAPLAADANEIERARSQHGPQCKSIPKLRLSQYPDPATGKQSMWTWCPDCGSVEKAQ